MARTSDSEFEVIREQLGEAWRAEVPNLVEIRRCPRLLYEHLADCALEIMGASRDQKTIGLPFQAVSTLRVINNDSPLHSAPKGICSPIKTEEIRKLEEGVRNVFGDTELCSTAWVGATHP